MIDPMVREELKAIAREPGPRNRMWSVNRRRRLYARVRKLEDLAMALYYHVNDPALKYRIMEVVTEKHVLNSRVKKLVRATSGEGKPSHE